MIRIIGTSGVAIAFAGAIAVQPASAQGKETQAQLRKSAKITSAKARATALKEVPNGRVQSTELERENGKVVYSFDIKVPGKAGIEEVNIDAVTGAMVAHEHETVKMEKKEAKTEKK